MAQISILGCGWLGFSLAEALLAEGFSIKGSTTSEHKMEKLKHAGIDPYLLELGSIKEIGRYGIEKFLAGSDTLIVNIPPKVRSNTSADYPSKINILLTALKASTVKNVLFVSSTSVYADDDCLVTEETVASPTTESGRQILTAEELLQHETSINLTILRFGGLIGEDRHPIRSLAGKSNIANPDAPINLIQRNDCIEIMMKVVKDAAWNQVFNAVYPDHPTRKEYYCTKAMQLNLPAPGFGTITEGGGKVISSEKLRQQLNYRFSYPV
ncbi:MAG TPA: NAD(P)H-binding protein [Flavobacterium sp.]|jgi:nucleoside-diphosphate-sugar epimerase